MSILFKIGNKAFEFGTIGKPNDELWNAHYRVRLGRRFWLFGKTFYYMIYDKRVLNES